MEGVHDNASAFMDQNIKNKQVLMAKVNILKQAGSFMSKSNISQLHGNAHKKSRKRRYFTQGIMKIKTQEKI